MRVNSSGGEPLVLERDARDCSEEEDEAESTEEEWWCMVGKKRVDEEALSSKGESFR
jgi:hypothetical protein